MKAAGPAYGLLLALCLAACSPSPDSYAPPTQYPDAHGIEPPLLTVGQPNGRGTILRDVTSKPGDRGGWTAHHPAFSFKVGSRTADLDFYMRFVVHSTTFADTGPVTLTIRVNGEVIDRPRFDTSGNHEYSHAVPARVLRAKDPVIVEVDVDPVWKAPDGTQLGIPLESIGFEEHAP